MPNILRTLVLMGLGAAELTEARVEATLDELIARGELAEREARLLAMRWQRERARRGSAPAKADRAARDTRSEDAAPLSELRALEARVEALTRRVHALDVSRA